MHIAENENALIVISDHHLHGLVRIHKGLAKAVTLKGGKGSAG